MSLPDEYWEYLYEVNDVLTEPMTNVCKRIIAVILMNYMFYNVVHKFQQLTSDSFFFPPLAFCFGLLNTYLFSNWDVLRLVTALSIGHGVFFEATLIVWRHCQTEVSDGLPWVPNFTLKFWSVSSALIGLMVFRYVQDIEEIIIPIVIITVKMIVAVEDILQRNANLMMTNDNGEAKTFFLIMGYIAFPSWISFKDFQSLPHKRREKNDRWRNMICSAATRAILLHLVSFKYVENEDFSEFGGRSTVIYMIQAFQHRCTYYYRAQLAELEIISLGIKKGGWVKHYMFDFSGAECSIVLTDFFIGFNIPVSSYFRNAISDRRTMETFLLFGLAPLMITASYSYYFAAMSLLFSVGILTQMTAVGGLISGTSIFMRLLHFQIAPSYRERGGPPLGYKGHAVRLVLIFFNQLRLSAIFNLGFEHIERALLFTFCGLILDVSIICNLLAIGTPQHRALQPTRSRRRRHQRL